jgi:small-conductance mechanosensitive channel
LQLLQGEELVISNKELTAAKVRNFRKLQKRRVVFTLHIKTDTPLAKLQKIPPLIQQIIEQQDSVEFERVHFTEFGAFSLNFLVVYYMTTDDYMKYMNTQQAINYAILEVFQKEGIDMPYPTHTVLLPKD